jgi:hypothetical protein
MCLCFPNFQLLKYFSRVESFDDIISYVATLDKPLFYQDATCDPSWVNAMEQEMASICDHQTWTLVDVPPSHKPILMKWVYKLKSGPPDTLPKHKACLVIRGNQQDVGLITRRHLHWSSNGQQCALLLPILHKNGGMCTIWMSNRLS